MSERLEHWLTRLHAEELPALSTTVSRLEQIAADDTVSMSKIGQIILPDHGLTTRVLQVVNTAGYRRGRNQITTVSKAAIVLGYDAIKHICITARMIDSMLQNRAISKPLYQRVIQLFAESFQAGMLTRMLLQEHDEESREEAYIAALLQNLGEVAFWSLGDPQIEALDTALRQRPQHPEQLIRSVLGCSFQKLNCTVAREWHMGEMLIQSLSEPQQRTPELKTIHLAKQYAANLLSETPSAKLNQKLIKQMAELTHQPQPQLEKRLKQCKEDTQSLALSYGSDAIYKQLRKTQSLPSDEPTESSHESPELLQLKLLRELNNLALETEDINSVIHTTMEGIYRGVGLNRVIVLMLSADRSQLLPRFLSSKQAEQDKQQFRLSLSNEPLLSEQVLSAQQPLWIKTQEKEWQGKLSQQMLNLIPAQGCLLAPIVCEQKCIGLFYADSESPLNGEMFAGFNHFVQQNNLCLNAILMRRSLHSGER